jgi:hypothetical protein
MKVKLHTGEELDSLLRSRNKGFPYLTVEWEDATSFIYRDERGRLVPSEEIVLSHTQERELHSWFDAYDRNPRRRPGKLYVRKPGSPLTVGLISCSAAKAPMPLSAENFYLGDLFRKSKMWVERNCDEWAILSAKYGLVLPDHVVKPYNVTLQKLDKDRRVGWAKSINYQCYMQWGEETTYVLLCGALYRLPFEEHNDRQLPFEVPMKGLGIGEQKAWLKQALTQ